MKKKIISIMLTAAVISSCVTAVLPAYAENTVDNIIAYSEDEQDIDFTYTVKDDDTVEISEWLEDSANIHIPVIVDDMPVTSIAAFAFAGLENVSLVYMPSTIEEIGDGAFMNCKHLKSFVVPDSVYSIGALALGCIYDSDSDTAYAVENFVIYGYDTDTARDYAEELGFEYRDYHELIKYNKYKNTIIVDGGDSRLHKLDIPSEIDGLPVTKIQRMAFENFYYLEEIELPDTIEEIGVSAFASCPITDICIPDSVTKVENGIFENCIYLESVTLSENMDKITDSMFKNCISLDYINIGDNITSIGEFAFLNCYSLDDIYIPAGVKKIAAQAFNHCINLEYIYVDSDNENYYSDDGVLFKITHWAGADDTVTLVCFPCASDIEEYVIPEDVREIDKSAFLDCQNLKRVVITDNVQRIGTNAFADSQSLEYIEQPKSAWLTESGNYRNCPNLTVYAEDSENFREYLEKEKNESICDIKVLSGDAFDIVRLKNYLLCMEDCPTPVEDDETDIFDLINAKKKAIEK